MALVIPISRVWKAKKRKLKDKIKLLYEEEEKLTRVLNLYILESRKVAEKLINANGIEEFSENYEITLKLLDTYHNDLFLIRTELTEKLENNFKNTCIDLDSGSSEEDGSLSFVSTAFSTDNLEERDYSPAFIVKKNNPSQSLTSSPHIAYNISTLVKANVNFDLGLQSASSTSNFGNQSFSIDQPVEELTVYNLDSKAITDGSKQPEILSNYHNNLEQSNSNASVNQSKISVTSPVFVPISTQNSEKSNSVHVTYPKHLQHLQREDSYSPEETVSPNSFLKKVNNIIDESPSFYKDEHKHKEAHEQQNFEIKSHTTVQEKAHIIEVPEEVGEEIQTAYTSPQTELSPSMWAPLNPNAPAFEAPLASFGVHYEPLVTDAESKNVETQNSINESSVAELNNDCRDSLAVVKSVESNTPEAKITVNEKYVADELNNDSRDSLAVVKSVESNIPEAQITVNEKYVADEVNNVSRDSLAVVKSAEGHNYNDEYESDLIKDNLDSLEVVKNAESNALEAQNTFYDEYVSDLIKDNRDSLKVAKTHPMPEPTVTINCKSKNNSRSEEWIAKITHVNNLIDFYVLFQPCEVEDILNKMWPVFKPNLPVAELIVRNWYIVAVPSQEPYRAELLSFNDQIARVRNLDVGPEFHVSVKHLFEIPPGDFSESQFFQIYAGQCSLYDYRSVPGWNTPEVVEDFKLVCLDNVFVQLHTREENDYGPHLVDVRLAFHNARVDIKEYCAAKQEERESNAKKFEIMSIESQSQERDSSSDRSIPENKFQWKASIKKPYCPAVYDEDTDLFICVMSYVENPTLFYVNVCLEDSGSLHLDELEENMNLFYNNLEMNEPVYKRAAVQSKSFWCCLKPNDPDGKIWYRVQVLSFLNEGASSPDSSGTHKSGLRRRKHRNKDPSAMLEVLSVDYGSTFKVALKNLYPLTKRFVELPSMALKCSLSNITPPDGQTEWPNESIRKFVNFTTLHEDRKLKILMYQSNEAICIVDIYNEKNISAREFLISVNAACYLVPDPDVQYLDSYNPMKEDYECRRNNLCIDIDDAGIALTGYAAKDESYICKYFMNTGRCPRLRSCRYLHIKTSGEYTVDKDTQWDTIPLILPPNGTRLVAQISSLINPESFYIVFPYGMKDASEIFAKDYNDENDKFYTSRDLLQLLEYDMNEYYQQNSVLKMALEISLSCIVACKFDETNSWHRAKVIGILENNDVEVLFLDYGNQACVPRTNIREIQPQFLNLPQQAILCYQTNISPANERWTPEAMDFFVQHAKEQTFFVKVIKSMSGYLYVDLYKSCNGQEIRLINLLVSEGHAKISQPYFKMKQRSDECESLNSSSSESVPNFLPG